MAFRNLGIKRKHWRYLVMIAKSPFDGKWYAFVDKALPFGSGISCSHFQRVNNVIKHIVVYRSGKKLVNYLDDYLFAALLRNICNQQVQQFLDVCREINLPVSLEKTFWGTTLLVFLGLLINTVNQTVSIPMEKIQRAISLITNILAKKSGKLTLKQLQKICGFLNFLGKGIIPGRAFTRRLYSFTSSKKMLKPHHHIRINPKMRLDLEMWLTFLHHPSAFCRPFLDFTNNLEAVEINMYSDSSGKIGMGATRFPHGCNKTGRKNF